MKEITVKVDDSNVKVFLNQIKKINEKFAKHNYPNLIYTIVDEDMDKGYVIYEVSSEFEKSNLAGETVYFEGIVDLMELGDEKSRLVKINNEVISHIMQTEHCVCDKCHKNIARGKYYVFSKNVKEIKSRDDFYILGSVCAKEYFPFCLESYFNNLDKSMDELMEYDELTEGCNSRCKNYVSAELVAEATNLVTNGCTSIYDKEYTLNKIENVFADLTCKSDKCKNEIKTLREKVSVNFDNKKSIEIATDYFNEHHSSDFEFNCHQILENIKNNDGEINVKFIRMTACAIYFGNVNARKENEKQEEISKSEYVGNVGDKFTKWELTFDKMLSFETKYGFTNMMKFLDKDENVVVWYTQKSTREISHNARDLQKGDKVTLKGTIKEHKMYGLEKQTIITRCKLA